jgi:AcrR family transcriptional regulator
MERTRIVNRAAAGGSPELLTGDRPPTLGRPRSEEAHRTILAAAVALVREVGFDLVTMDGIATRAGVGKATVYRRWSNKETLVAEAIGRIVRAIPVPDTGSTEDDLLRVMQSVLRMYKDPATGPLLSGLVAAMARNDAIAQAVRGGMVARWRDAVRQVLARGVTRGELQHNVDIELTIDLLSGPLFHRFLMTGGPVDERLVRGVVGVVLRGLARSGHSVNRPGSHARGSGEGRRRR